MDIQLPNLDGLQSTRQIRSLGFSAPIVALTAFADESNARECIDSGMDYFLPKPIKRPALKQVLKRYCPTIPEDPEERDAALEKERRASEAQQQQQQQAKASPRQPNGVGKEQANGPSAGAETSAPQQLTEKPAESRKDDGGAPPTQGPRSAEEPETNTALQQPVQKSESVNSSHPETHSSESETNYTTQATSPEDTVDKPSPTH